MPKDYIKITVQDIEIAEEFFENERHLNEFLAAVIAYYRQKNPVFKTKIVKKYFQSYRKTMDFVMAAKKSGEKGGRKRVDNQDYKEQTLKGSLEGSVKEPLNEPLNLKDNIKRIKDNSIRDNSKTTFSEINISHVEEKNKPYFEQAKAFYSLILENQKKIDSPGAKKIEKNPAKKWIDQIRLMVEVDEITVDQMRQVWNFLSKNDFWNKTCQSPENLRKNFSQMYNQSKRSNGKQTNIPSRNEIQNAVSDFLGTNKAG